MYRKDSVDQLEFEEFSMPFGGRLSCDNRWIILAKQIPWQEVEEIYSAKFKNQKTGCPAKPARVALGSLLIKERLGLTDRETVLQIQENPYLQYFLGFSEFNTATPFDHSLMTYFRKRFDKDALVKINELIFQNAFDSISHKNETDNGDKNDDDEEPLNKGKLIVDATCTPADVSYPTDLKLINEAREKTERMIDNLHEPFVGKEKKPRMYRNVARRNYLSVAKQKRPGYKKIRKAIRKQLGFLRRNLKNIDEMILGETKIHLSNKQCTDFGVIKKLFEQQRYMYENKTHTVANRIVSISQPHVRPIIRGKAKCNVEFGAKVAISLVDGFSFVDKISWDSYNESTDLIKQIESYKKRFGFYPESVHGDQIYRTRENRTYCAERGVRFSGPPLGRPKKATPENAKQLKQEKRQHRQDEIDRIAVEGKFGQGKRRFSLGRIMTRLAETSESVIMIAFMVMNLEKILASTLYFLFFVWTSLLSLTKKPLQHHHYEQNFAIK